MTVLPIEKPILSTYPNYASYTSVLLNHEQGFSWIANNLLQLVLGPKGGLHYLLVDDLFKTCQLLEYKEMGRGLIDKFTDNICSFLIECLNDGNYVMVLADHYYLEGSIFYSRKNHNHSTFIYGFDLHKQVFYVGDHFFSTNFKYGYGTVSFLSMEKAYSSIDSNPFGQNSLLKNTVLIKLKEDSNILFPNERMFELLAAYLNSKNPYLFGTEVQSQFLGLNIYTTLIEDNLNKGNQRRDLDRRIYHLLVEHKKFMQLRINYLFENGQLIRRDSILEQYSMLEKQAIILLNSVLKYNMTKNKGLLVKINNKLEQLYLNEQALIIQILSVIR